MRTFLTLHIVLVFLNLSNAFGSDGASSIGFDDLPSKYKLSVSPDSPLPALNLDVVNPHATVPSERLSSWCPETIQEKGYMTIHGCDFLNHTWMGFSERFPGFNSVDLSEEGSQKFYFSGLWDHLCLSASLVNKDKYACWGEYGLVLDIPPSLILATYPKDATTMTHDRLIREHIPYGRDPSEFFKEYLIECPSLHHTYEMSESGCGSYRVFAPGESEDSHPFMTPDEMIVRGRSDEHNELKIVPKWGGSFIKIRGFWYLDVDIGKGMMRKEPPSFSVIEELKQVARDLGIDLIKLSTQEKVML